MARGFTRASSHYLEYAGAVGSAPSLTFALWFNSVASTGTSTMIGLYNSASNINNYRLETGSAAQILVAFHAGPTGSAQATGVATWTTNTWNHAACKFVTDGVGNCNDVSVFLNGANKITNNTSVPHATGLNRTSIGRRGTSTAGSYMDGRIAEVAIWSMALSDAQIAQLAKGIRPWKIEWASLIGYWPLWGTHTTEIDLAQVPHGMTVNSAVAASHAPVRTFSLWRPSHLEIEAAPAAGHPAIRRLGLVEYGRPVYGAEGVRIF